MKVIAEPEKTNQMDDGTVHYLKSIPENAGRVLRVVIASGEQPRVITAFFDRRERWE